MGWLFAVGLASGTLALLWRCGCPRVALELIAAALLIALAGYGWQGSPDMPGTAAGTR
ncbi:MAG: hypothetical protein KGM17_10655 [Sphingomonadales bacterium]|nr:hypothetical protein [Sphingomonadales bacterium]